MGQLHQRFRLMLALRRPSGQGIRFARAKSRRPGKDAQRQKRRKRHHLAPILSGKINGAPRAIRTPDPQIRSLIAGVESKGENRQPIADRTLSNQSVAKSVQTGFGSENENPGALAGATGADIEGFWSWAEHNLKRESAASAVIEAVLDCAPDDRVMVLETILDQIRPGFPQGYNIDLMQEAGFWADASTRHERKAYLWACWQRLPIADQSAFLGHVQGRAAA